MGILSALQGFGVIGIIILIGYLAAHFKIGGPTAQRTLQLFAFFVMSPCLMFTILSKEHVADVFTSSMAVAFGSAVAVAIIFSVLARTIFRLKLENTTVGSLVSMYMNANNIGLPVATYILDDPTTVVPIILMQQVIFTPIALTLLDLSTSSTTGIKGIVTQLGHQPILIGVALGVAVSLIDAATGIYIVPDFLFDPLNLVGQAMVPVILMAFGMSLRDAHPLADGGIKAATITAALLKTVAMPAIAYLMARLGLGLDGAELYSCVVLAALPTAQNVFNYAARYDAGTAFARDGILLSTLLSPIAIIVVAGLLG